MLGRLGRLGGLGRMRGAGREAGVGWMAGVLRCTLSAATQRSTLLITWTGNGDLMHLRGLHLYQSRRAILFVKWLRCLGLRRRMCILNSRAARPGFVTLLHASQQGTTVSQRTYMCPSGTCCLSIGLWLVESQNPLEPGRTTCVAESTEE
jgi:hypothetical protein